MRPRLGLLLLAVLAWLATGPGQALGEDLGSRLDTGRKAYAAGRFVAAAASLDAAYRDGARNATVCLAAARAWDQAGNKGRAVLWLVRAHGLAPDNREAGKALDAVGARLPGPTLLLGSRLSPRGLVWLALAGNGLFWLGLALVRRVRRSLASRFVLVAGVLAGWLWLEAAVALLGPQRWPVGVVLGDTPVLCAPEAGAEVLFRLPAGQVVTLGPTRDGFRRITVPPDRLGWLPLAATEAAWP